jgi:hypothetical protein
MTDDLDPKEKPDDEIEPDETDPLDDTGENAKTDRVPED